MSRTAKTDMPKSGRPSSAQARAVCSAWRYDRTDSPLWKIIQAAADAIDP
jgi:hypothetical protein